MRNYFHILVRAAKKRSGRADNQIGATSGDGKQGR